MEDAPGQALRVDPGFGIQAAQPVVLDGRVSRVGCAIRDGRGGWFVTEAFSRAVGVWDRHGL